MLCSHVCSSCVLPICVCLLELHAHRGLFMTISLQAPPLPLGPLPACTGGCPAVLPDLLLPWGHKQCALCARHGRFGGWQLLQRRKRAAVRWQVVDAAHCLLMQALEVRPSSAACAHALHMCYFPKN